MTIRGISTLTNGTNIENNVAVYIDGFYTPSSTDINVHRSLGTISDGLPLGGGF